MRIAFVDFETYYDSKTYTLSKMPTAQYIRDERFLVHGASIAIDNGPVVWHTRQTLQDAILALKDTKVVCYNSLFDGAILAWKYGLKPAMWGDAMALVRGVVGTKTPRVDLRTMAAYFKLPAKGEMRTNGLRDLTQDQLAELGTYCDHDTWLCREIYKRLAPHLRPPEHAFIDWTVRAFVEPHLELDTAILRGAADKERARRTAIFEELGIPKAVFSSSDQFADLLTREGYEPPTKTSPKTGKAIFAFAATDEAFIAMQESGDAHLEDLCEARVAAKNVLAETRAEKLWALSKTGPFSVPLNYSGARQTHRLGGAGGINFQNFTRGGELRAAVKAPEGNTLVVADYAAIELRLLAALTRDPKLCALLRAKADVYCHFASGHFGRLITKADKGEREFGKVAVLGLGYGMGAKKFLRTYQLAARKLAKFGIALPTLDESGAAAVVEHYRTEFVGVPAYWQYLDGLIGSIAAPGVTYLRNLPAVTCGGGAIVLPSGLKIQYPGLQRQDQGWRKQWTYSAYRNRKLTPDRVSIYGGKLAENLCQSLAGELCKGAIMELAKKWHVVSMVHDEIIMVAPSDRAEEAKTDMERVLSTPPRWWPSVMLGCEAKIAKNWLEAK